MVKVRLISDGSYRDEGEPSIIGKVFYAVPWGYEGYDIKVNDLRAAGLVIAEGDDTLYFYNSEVEVIDD